MCEIQSNDIQGVPTLWHKVDISTFHCHKSVNFCNNFVSLSVADNLKSKIWKIYANILSLHPLRRVENTPIEKKYENFFSSKLGM